MYAELLFFWLFPAFPNNWSNVNVFWGWLLDDPVPNKSKPKISSLAFYIAVGPFLVWPGPIIALLVYVFFYFLAFSLMKVFISFLVG